MIISQRNVFLSHFLLVIVVLKLPPQKGQELNNLLAPLPCSALCAFGEIRLIVQPWMLDVERRCK